MSILTSHQLIDFHDKKLADIQWPSSEAEIGNASNIWQWISENHRNNACLWAQEDLARRTKASDSQIAENKRAIDRFNQARNDATERIDELLLMALNLVDSDSARTDTPLATVRTDSKLHSETAGAMIDRMSIMALKIKAMRQQTVRTDVDETHRLSCEKKLARLIEQRLDLGRCLEELINDAQAGKRHFKIYRQFKMYNDPRLNPALVAEQQ